MTTKTQPERRWYSPRNSIWITFGDPPIKSRSKSNPNIYRAFSSSFFLDECVWVCYALLFHGELRCHLLRLFKCLVIKHSIDIAYDSWIDFHSLIYIICIRRMKRMVFERERLRKEREKERKWVFVDVCFVCNLLNWDECWKLVCCFGKYLPINHLLKIHLLFVSTLNLTFCSFNFLFQLLGRFSFCLYFMYAWYAPLNAFMFFFRLCRNSLFDCWYSLRLFGNFQFLLEIVLLVPHSLYTHIEMLIFTHKCVFFLRDEKRTICTLLRDQSVRLHVSLLTEHPMRMRRMVLRMVGKRFFFFAAAVVVCHCHMPSMVCVLFSKRFSQYCAHDAFRIAWCHVTYTQTCTQPHTHTHCRDTFSQFRHDFPILTER